MEITAKSLILDLLTYVRRGDMPVAALVEAASLFGLAENNVRVTVSNLVAAGEIVRDDRGAYRLAPTARDRIGRRVRWIQLEEEQVSWKGDWVAVHASRRGRGPTRARRERLLDRLGFRELSAGLHVRPDNRRGGVEAIRADFAEHLTHDDDSPLIYGVHDLGNDADDRARELWTAEDLPARHRALRERLAQSRQSLERIPETDACVEGFTLAGEAARQLASDPRLPDEICPSAPRRDLRAELERYEPVARDVWQPLMRRHGLTKPTTARSPRLYAGMAS